MTPNPNIVSMLKDLLSRAEAGGIRAFVAIALDGDGNNHGGVAGGTPRSFEPRLRELAHALAATPYLTELS